MAGITSRITDVPGITSVISDAPLQFSRLLAAAIGISPSVAAQLTVAVPLAGGVGISPSVAAQLTVARQLAAGLGLSPDVVATLINPRLLAAAPSIVSTVAATLTNPKALAAAVGVTPSVSMALTNARALAAALGVSPAVAATLSNPLSSPLNIAGCVAWFDMQDAASYTQAGTVTSITNKASSVAWNTAQTAFPNYSAAGLNGHPCMDLNGVTMGISSTEAAVVSAFTNTPAYTVLGVVQQDLVDSVNAWFGFGSSAVSGVPNSGYFGTNTTAAGVWIAAVRTSAGTAINAESSATANSNANVQEVWHTGTMVSWSSNGAAADPSAIAQDSASVAPNRCAIGCNPRQTPVAFLDGKIGEIVIYNTELSAALRSRVRQYLGTKWGISVAA